jgi:hypothetical protein
MGVFWLRGRGLVVGILKVTSAAATTAASLGRRLRGEGLGVSFLGQALRCNGAKR